MNEEEIKQTAIRLLKKVAPDSEPEKLGDNDEIRSKLGLDSFDALQFIVAIDEKFGFETPEEDYGKITTLKKLASYLREQLAVRKN